MVLSSRVARASIKLGFVQLIFGCAGVACGAVARNKFIGPVGTTIGLWAVYFIVLGIICVAAGFFKDSRIYNGGAFSTLRRLLPSGFNSQLEHYLGIALVAHVIGLIIALIGIVISALFWVFLNTCSSSLVVPVPGLSDFCACGVVGDLTKYEVSCSDLRTVRNVTAASTFVYLVLEITSLIGLIYSCIGICCASKEPTSVTVTTVNPPRTSKPEARPMIMTKLSNKKAQPKSGKNTKNKH